MPKTLEELQADIIAVTEKLNQAETERDRYKSENVQLSADLERVRAHNQKLFEKVSNQILGDDKDDDNDNDTPAPSCEIFALGLKI